MINDTTYGKLCFITLKQITQSAIFEANPKTIQLNTFDLQEHIQSSCTFLLSFSVKMVLHGNI